MRRRYGKHGDDRRILHDFKEAMRGVYLTVFAKRCSVLVPHELALVLLEQAQQVLNPRYIEHRLCEADAPPVSRALVLGLKARRTLSIKYNAQQGRRQIGLLLYGNDTGL